MAYNDWTSGDEMEFVKGLGTGRWYAGADRRHSRQWWLSKYLEVTLTRIEETPIHMGRELATKILLGMEAKA